MEKHNLAKLKVQSFVTGVEKEKIDGGTYLTFASCGSCLDCRTVQLVFGCGPQ